MLSKILELLGLGLKAFVNWSDPEEKAARRRERRREGCLRDIERYGRHLADGDEEGLNADLEDLDNLGRSRGL